MPLESCSVPIPYVVDGLAAHVVIGNYGATGLCGRTMDQGGGLAARWLGYRVAESFH